MYLYLSGRIYFHNRNKSTFVQHMTAQLDMLFLHVNMKLGNPISISINNGNSVEYTSMVQVEFRRQFLFFHLHDMKNVLGLRECSDLPQCLPVCCCSTGPLV